MSTKMLRIKYLAFLMITCQAFSPPRRYHEMRTLSSLQVSSPNQNEDARNPVEYWFDQRIHNLGNNGVMGALHAAVAALSTKLIDVLAYDGVDIRQQVGNNLARIVNKSNARVLDLCCGVGISTRALARAFPDAEVVIGMDTSKEMITMADFLSKHLTFAKTLQGSSPKLISHLQAPKFVGGNAENTQLPDESFDLVTVMYAFHEIPRTGRNKILQEARRLLRPGGTLAIIDISVDYKPSKSMLTGEPYVLEFKRNIQQQLASFVGFTSITYKRFVDGHVSMWVLKRSFVKI